MIEKSATSFGGGGLNYYQTHKMQAKLRSQQYRQVHKLKIKRHQKKYRRQVAMGARIPQRRMNMGGRYVTMRGM
jgi:hypothetical protein